MPTTTLNIMTTRKSSIITICKKILSSYILILKHLKVKHFEEMPRDFTGRRRIHLTNTTYQTDC